MFGWEVMCVRSGMLWGEVARVPSGDELLGDIFRICFFDVYLGLMITLWMYYFD